MAVPFRALDTVAERTEFGHPDVAVVLTVLSYYQSGLTLQQFTGALLLLQRRPDKDSVYADWMRECTAPPAALRSLDGINMKDESQLIALHVLLRRHTGVLYL